MVFDAFAVLFGKDTKTDNKEINPDVAKPVLGKRNPSKRGRPVSQVAVPKMPKWVNSDRLFHDEVDRVASAQGTTPTNAYLRLRATQREVLAAPWGDSRPADARAIPNGAVYLIRPGKVAANTAMRFAIHDAPDGTEGIRIDEFESEILGVGIHGVVLTPVEQIATDAESESFGWGRRVAVEIDSTGVDGERIRMKIILHETGRILDYWKTRPDEPWVSHSDSPAAEWLTGTIRAPHPADTIYTAGGLNPSVARRRKMRRKK